MTRARLISLLVCVSGLLASGCPFTDDYAIVSSGGSGSGGGFPRGGTSGGESGQAGVAGAAGMSGTAGAAHGGNGIGGNGIAGNSAQGGGAQSSGGSAGDSSGGVAGSQAGSTGGAPTTQCLINWDKSQKCDKCSKETQADRRRCRDVLECYIVNACNPSTCGGNDGLCGINKFGAGLEPIQIAGSVYTCMCEDK